MQVISLLVFDRKNDPDKWATPVDFDLEQGFAVLPPGPGGRAGKPSGIVKRFAWQAYRAAYQECEFTPNPLPPHSVRDDIHSFLKGIFPGFDVAKLKKNGET